MKHNIVMKGGGLMSDELVIEVTEKELAEKYLGLSDRRIRQLFKQGVLIKTQKGKYDLQKSVLGYVNHLREKEKTQNESLEKLKISKEAESLMHERLKKRKTELQVLQIEKKLHAQEDVEYFWNTMILAAKSRITSIPVKCAPILVGIEDRKEIQSILKREINDALNEIAEYDINQFDKDLEEDDEQ